MNKNTASITISGNDYFKYLLRKNKYTAKSFMNTYNETFPEDKISISTIQSLCSGRRSFTNIAAITLLRIARILEHPNCSLFDYSYGSIPYNLVFGYEID